MVAIYTSRNEEPAVEPDADGDAEPRRAAGEYGRSWLATSRWNSPDDHGADTAPVIALDGAFVWSELRAVEGSSPGSADGTGARRRHPAAGRATQGNLAIAEVAVPVDPADAALSGADVAPLRRPGGEVRPGPWAPPGDRERSRRGGTGVTAPAGDRSVPRWLPDRATRLRRRRLAVLLGFVVAVVGLVVGVRVLASLSAVPTSPAPAPLDGGAPPVAGRTYVVQPGDTLWSIARTIAPDRDPRPVVDALRKANGGPNLQVGGQLTIPGG
jgi:LysM repeat protein